MAIADYPDGVNTSGPTISRLMDQPVKFEKELYQYDDGGCDVNVQPCGLKAWTLEYDGLSESDVATIRSHYNSAQGQVGQFNFYHRRDATTYTGVQYQSFKIGKHPKKWSVPVTVTLVMFA